MTRRRNDHLAKYLCTASASVLPEPKHRIAKQIPWPDGCGRTKQLHARRASIRYRMLRNAARQTLKTQGALLEFARAERVFVEKLSNVAASPGSWPSQG
jgi:hypothetical protein